MEVIPGLVSVVMATYNRSNILRLAIESVRWQTYADWELIVVGDCCTDDTADVVASFLDPRIRFFNLSTNFGEQSGPNNFGCGQARGEFIAFLNHDDLFYPHHLTNAVRLLRDEQADLVFGRRYSIDGPNDRICLRPPPGRFTYEPTSSVPASCWVFRRELFVEVGPWRPAVELYNYPSQDWIFRAFKAGKTIRCTPKASVVVISSLVVDNTYRDRRDIEQRTYYERLRREPDYAPLDDAPSTLRHSSAFKRGLTVLATQQTWRGFRGKVIHLGTIGLIRVIGRVFGRHPHPSGAYWFIAGRGRKGRFIETLRHRRGLPYKKLTKENAHE